MSKIVIIGEKKDILPYQSIGVEIEPVKTVAETVSILRKTAQNPKVTIILITENMAEQCLDTITELRSKTAKAITIVPTEQGSRRTSIIELNKEIARAVGMDILTKTE
ncbi:MAG TPA: V-type ATP synthase subunit F [Candidatus Wunengus sp. YC60]|uniref:V-type ATP synthase subunit F n=1 Tax=Candidatus Wunengus sp. YC60 TaxID=3367697 RepID=UPI004029FF7D